MGEGLLLVEDQASGTDWPLIVTAIGAILGPFIAVIAVLTEGKRMRLQLGVDNMWRLIEKWDQPSLKASRSEAAEYLLDNWNRRENLPNSALVTLDLFELLAYLVIRSQTLSIEDAWINFSGPAIQWWHVCRPGIEAFRADDPTIYEDFASLIERLIKMEEERRGMTREELQPSDGDLIVFLQGEKALVEKSPPWQFWS